MIASKQTRRDFLRKSAAIAAAGVAVAYLFTAVNSECVAAAQPVNYARPCEPEIKPAFLPLPLGAVEPSGWLRDWALAARDGIAGHLDEHHPVFGDGWKGTSIHKTCKR
jgi:hypothetical protein